MNKEYLRNVFKLSNWNLKLFFVFHGLSAFLIVSWLFPPTRYLWDVIDLAVFSGLNSLIPAFGKNCSLLIAVMSNPIFDIFMFIILIFPLFVSGLAFPQRDKFKYLFMLGFLLLSVVAFSDANWIYFERLSPSRALDSVHRLIDVGFYT